MISKNKFSKLIKNPNQFFFDYFAKRINGSVSKVDKALIQRRNQSIEYLMPPGYHFDEKRHPWVQIAKKFDLKTGATTGHPDQSLLVDCRDLIDILTFTLWVAHGLRSQIRVYTLGGGFEATIRSSDLLNPKKAEWIYSKIHKKPDFVIEFLGEFDNNFAAHLFLYDIDDVGLFVIRSGSAFVKKSMPNAFEKIYPSIIDKFGNYEFGTPWPVDVVYTWVTKDDPKWVAMWNETFPEQLFDPDRYSSRDELRYSLRAIEKFLPWFRKVHIVTNCEKPDWLKDHSKLNWVPHVAIFPDVSVLPTFNSHAIEACLHRIPGLSENFIYFNDDVFVNRPCYYSDFFDEQGRSICHLEPYGMVYEGNLFDINREYLAASINSQSLIAKRLPEYRATRLHKHTPFALRKKVLAEIETNFNDAIVKTRSSLVRSLDDINLTSFMYHHYALGFGHAVCGDCNSLIVRPSNIKIISDAGSRVYKYLCFNDGAGSSGSSAFSAAFKKFVQTTYPYRGAFEIEGKAFGDVSVSVVIMAYKDRVYRIPYLRRMLGNASVSFDDGSLGLLKNSINSWMMHESNTDFSMVIQDDGVICEEFYKRLQEVFVRIADRTVATDNAYSLYFRLKNPSKKLFSIFNEKARAGLNQGYFIDRYLRFGLALVVPTRFVPEMIDYANNLNHLGSHDDTRYSYFLAKRNIPVVYTLPSLVNQEPSLVSVNTGRSNQNSCATWFIDGFNGFNKQESPAEVISSDYLAQSTTLLVSNGIVDEFTANHAEDVRSQDADEINQKTNLSIDDSFPLFWWNGTPNFGDEISPYLVEKITQKKVVDVRGLKSCTGLLSVGSIVQQIDRPGMTLWGSGIIRGYGPEVTRKLALFKPKQITALRGHLTFDYVTKKLGWEADNVFGDPALLMPKFFDPGSGSEGVVVCPHYQHYKVLKYYSQDYEVVNVRTGVEPVVSSIALSRACISSSLHGLIIAQAYEVPWVWLRIVDSPLHGGDFKFEDFFSVLERAEVSVFNVNLDQLFSLDIDSIAAKARLPRTKYDLSALLDAFPKDLRAS